MENYRRPRDVAFPTPGPVPEYIRKATIKRIIQQQQEERLKRESNTSENSSQNNNNNVALQQEEEENEDRTVTVTKTTTTNLEINGIDHNKKINGHSQEIKSGENEDQMLVDHKDDESEKDPLNPNENISNNKNNNEPTREIILSLQDQESLNKEPINPEPPPEPPDDENGESSNKKDSGKSILKSQNDDKEEEEEESSDDSLPDEETLVNKLEELTAKKKQLWQQLRDAKAKQTKKEQTVASNEINNLREETSTNYNTGMHDQSYRVDRHNMPSTSYVPSNRDQYDSNYVPSYHHEGDITAFHHQLPFGIKRMNEQTSPPLGPMNKRMRHPPNGMYESINHGAPSMYGPPPTGPSAMTGNGMMGRGREDPYSYYHRNEFRPPTAPYIDRAYGRGPINNMQRRLSGNPPTRPAARPPDRPRGRY